MRIRSTKPEFWRSKRTADITEWEHRLVLKGLESYVDDNGVGKDDLALIVSDIFPRDLTLDPSRTLKRVKVALDALSQAGFLWRYEVDGEKLIFISWWEKAQYINRPSKGRLPRPDGTFEYGESEIGSPLLSPQEDDLSPQTLNRGTGEQGNSTNARSDTTDRAPDPRFQKFWDTYDKKTGRKKCEAKWQSITQKHPDQIDHILTAAKTYIDHQRAKGEHPKFTKDPLTWLNGEHWNDELPTTPPPTDDAPEPEFGSLEWERKYNPWKFQ